VKLGFCAAGSLSVAALPVGRPTILHRYANRCLTARLQRVSLSASWTSAVSWVACPTFGVNGELEIEAIVGEEDGYTAESDAAILLQGLDIPDELHDRTMAELQGGQKVRVLLAQALFKDPAKVEFVSVTAEGRWPAIESGRADMGVGGTTTYPDRAIRVAFTRPFIDSGISVLVSKKSGIKTLADLNQDKFTVASLNNPQMADRAKRFFPKSKVLTFDTPAAQFLAVRSGRAHALQIDTPSAEYWAAHNKDEMEVLPGLLGASQNNGVFMKPGDFKVTGVEATADFEHE